MGDQVHQLSWQPIETAPIDKRVLLYNGYWGVYTAEYDGAQWPIWNSDGGPYYPVPTHWMPLPEPPSAFDEQGEPDSACGGIACGQAVADGIEAVRTAIA